MSTSRGLTNGLPLSQLSGAWACYRSTGPQLNHPVRCWPLSKFFYDDSMLRIGTSVSASCSCQRQTLPRRMTFCTLQRMRMLCSTNSSTRNHQTDMVPCLKLSSAANSCWNDIVLDCCELMFTCKRSGRSIAFSLQIFIYLVLVFAGLMFLQPILVFLLRFATCNDCVQDLRTIFHREAANSPI